MTIIETVKDKIAAFPGLSDFTGTIHNNFTSGKGEDYGLVAEAPYQISEDIQGNETWLQSYTLYATRRTLDDYQRLVNSNFLVGLAHYLRRLGRSNATIAVGNDTINATIISYAPSSGLACAISEGGDETTYQVMIAVTYKIGA